MKTAKAKVVKLSSKTARSLSSLPTLENLNPKGSRAMFSLKDKRKFMKKVCDKNLPIPLVAKMTPNVTQAMLYAWRKDYKAGRYHIKNAVAVSRGY